MKKSTQQLVTVLATLFIAIPLMIVWGGFALSVLWGWFIVPLGLPPIGIAMAAGLMLTVSFIRSKCRDDDGDKNYERIIHGFAAPVFALAFGWIISRFM